jgi:Asp-tRNA(Asn)/Glu-tRNA(Gln) amidotransferase A subunit family amidase
VISADGLQTRAGSGLPPEILAGPEATVVQRLRAAGALVAGKTVTAEFAMTAPGPTRNPHDRRHTPGGSSSGSAAAVAAGLVPLALGTQTLASVIRPAAYCGVAGYRATHGRIPVDGVIAYAPSLDTVGCLAPDAGALATAAAVLCDGWQPGAPPGSAPVLGIPAGAYLQQVSPHALAAFRSQVTGLAAAGLTIREIPAPADPAEIGSLLHIITRYEAAQVHAGWFAEHAGRYQHATAQAIREGQLLARRDYDSARRQQARFRADLAAVMQREGIDAWVTPAATGPAPAGLRSTGSPVMSMPWSLAGCPAVSLPAGRAGLLPLGLQFVAAPGRDEQLLHWAAVFERALAEQRG